MVPSPLLLELLSCPLCARSLETLELELGDLEGEADGLHDFPQVRAHAGALVTMVNGKDEGCGGNGGQIKSQLVCTDFFFFKYIF